MQQLKHHKNNCGPGKFFTEFNCYTFCVVTGNEGLTFFNNIISFITLAGQGGLWVKNKKPLQMKLLLDGNLLIMPGCVYITVLSQARPEVSLCFDGVQAILFYRFEH